MDSETGAERVNSHRHFGRGWNWRKRNFFILLKDIHHSKMLRQKSIIIDYNFGHSLF